MKRQIHRFLAELLWAFGEQRAHEWGDKLWERLLETATIGIGSESTTMPSPTNGGIWMMTPCRTPSLARFLRIDLSPLAEALKQMPLRARGGQERVSERLKVARDCPEGRKSNCSGRSFSPKHAGGRPCW